MTLDNKKPGDPIRAGEWNELAKRAGAEIEMEGADFDRGPHGSRKSGPVRRVLVLYEQQADWATDGSDDVKSCLMKVVAFSPSGDAYAASDDWREERVYFSLSATAPNTHSGARWWSTFNEQSGRWEAIARASSSSSGSCLKDFADIHDYTSLTGYNGAVKQALIHDTSGCLAWETITTCP